MKKVIRGRLYDTATAEFIGDVSGGAEFPSDFNYWSESLYRKKTGEYFLYCYGGALSQYAEHCGSNSGSGERIKPMSLEEAQAWGEKNMDGDAYINEFGEPEEDYTKKPITLNLPQIAIDKLKAYAVKNEKSASAVVAELIENYLKG